jgi:predicted phosphodiesterase
MTMRLLPVRDLHLERRSLDDIPSLEDESFDVLVSAGVHGEGHPEKAIQSLVAIARGKPSIMVRGNHDVYTLGPEDRRTISDFDWLLRDEVERQNAQAHRDIVTVLSPEEPVCEIGETRFIGLTLWTDWVQASRWIRNPTLPHTVERWAAEARVAAGHWRNGAREYQAIRTEKGRWSPYDAVAEHAREKAILLDQLVSYHHGPNVVVTHHSPLADCADAYRDRGLPWWAPAFFGSDLLPTLSEEIRPDVWIFGHVHAAFDLRCGKTRAVSNPVEGGNFNSHLIIEI